MCYRVCVSVRRRFRRVSCVLSRRNIPLSTPFSGSRCESPVTRGTKESTVEEEVVVVSRSSRRCVSRSLGLGFIKF